MIRLDFATFRRHLFVAVYGMGSWLSINAMYVELPLLVNKIPEGWNFASYMVVVLQIMCFLALLYSIIAYKFESLIEGNVYMISGMCLMSVIGILMSAFVYNIRSVIFGSEHSALLLIAIGIMGLPCTVSDMLFMPYISKFKESHIVATYFIGMGLSALVPSGISFAQTVPYKKNVTTVTGNGTSFTSEVLVEGSFSVTVFMCLMALVMSVSLCGFLLLVRDRKVNSVVQIEHPKAKFDSGDSLSAASATSIIQADPHRLSKHENAFLLFLSLLLGGAQNSVMPVVLPFASQRYGQQTYHLANSLFIMANPIFCFIPFFLSIRRNLLFVVHTVACALCLAFFVTLGAVDLFHDTSLATALICVIAPLTSGLMSWERAAIAEVLRNHSNEKGLFWCGTFTQIGAFTAAILMFLLTNEKDPLVFFRKAFPRPAEFDARN
uniref:Riboflavin transporter n=1 Tax=Steinernema glaseri TaxID=37863 RepID=A0A1I7ZP95_9BILA